MPFGVEVRQRTFAGLDLRRRQASGGDLFARTFENMQVAQVGNMAKRKGYSQAMHLKFPGSVKAIIQTQYCFFLKRFLIHVGDNPTGDEILIGRPIGSCQNVPPAINFMAEGSSNPNRISLTWGYPANSEWVSRVLIIRSIAGEVTGREDPNAITIIDAPKLDPATGQLRTSFDDLNVLVNVRFFYGLFLVAFC